jgi:hypothetical protein
MLGGTQGLFRLEDERLDLSLGFQQPLVRQSQDWLCFDPWPFGFSLLANPIGQKTSNTPGQKKKECDDQDEGNVQEVPQIINPLQAASLSSIRGYSFWVKK